MDGPSHEKQKNNCPTNNTDFTVYTVLERL